MDDFNILEVKMFPIKSFLPGPNASSRQILLKFNNGSFRLAKDKEKIQGQGLYRVESNGREIEVYVVEWGYIK